MQYTLTSAELVEFVERIGPELDWSSRYTDLAATAIGAVFRADGLDEETDEIAMGSEIVSNQLVTLEADLLNRGRSVNTVKTYKTVWRRVSDMAEDWLRMRSDGHEDEFWATSDKYRDTRRRRRSTRSDPSSASDPTISRLSSFEYESFPSATMLHVEVTDGTVIIQMPYPLSADEKMTVIEALLGSGTT